MTSAPVTLHPPDRDARPADPPALRVAVVLGGGPGGRTGPRIAAWVVDRLGADDGIELEVVDLAAGDEAARVEALRGAVVAADAVVLVVPEHNHSFPGALKTAVDALRDEWVTAVVGIVSHGGVSGGLRATEQLRLVFAELHAHVVRDTVSFHGVGGPPDVPAVRRPGGPTTGAEHPADAALDRLVASLRWWAGAVAAGHRASPYPGRQVPGADGTVLSAAPPTAPRRAAAARARG